MSCFDDALNPMSTEVCSFCLNMSMADVNYMESCMCAGVNHVAQEFYPLLLVAVDVGTCNNMSSRYTMQKLHGIYFGMWYIMVYII